MNKGGGLTKPVIIVQLIFKSRFFSAWTMLHHTCRFYICACSLRLITSSG